MEAKRNTPSLFSLAIVAVIAIGVIYYLVMAMNTGDAQWFRTSFSGIPEEVIVHCYGQDVVITPTDPNYTTLNEVFNATVSGEKRWDPLTMSEVTYEDYQTNEAMLVVESIYQPAVRVHSNTKFFSRVDRLIIPIVGRHAQYNTVFGRNAGNTTAGSFHVESIAELADYLAAEGICVEP